MEPQETAAAPGPAAVRPAGTAVADPAERPPAPVTGDALVDEALDYLSRAGALALPEQVAVFDAVHRALASRLDDLEG